MKKLILVVGLIAVLAGLPALAHSEGACKGSTQECLNKMASKLKHKGLVGIKGQWDEAIDGYRIESYLENGNAKASGVKIGDVLVAINGIRLSDEEGSNADKSNRMPGSEVKITVMRDGSEQTMNVVLVGLTEEQIAKSIGAHMLNHVQVAKAD